MVWQAAQLSANRLAPVGQVGPLQVDVGMNGGRRGERVDEGRDLEGLLRCSAGRLALGLDLRGVAAGIRPVVTQKSTVAGPTPTGTGPPCVPWASAPWQLEQFCSKSAWPAGM